MKSFDKKIKDLATRMAQSNNKEREYEVIGTEIVIGEPNRQSTFTFNSFFRMPFYVKSLSDHETFRHARTISSTFTSFDKQFSLLESKKDNCFALNIVNYRFFESSRKELNGIEPYMLVTEQIHSLDGDEDSLIASYSLEVKAEGFREKIRELRFLSKLFGENGDASTLNKILDLIIEIEGVYLKETAETDFYKNLIFSNRG